MSVLVAGAGIALAGGLPSPSAANSPLPRVLCYSPDWTLTHYRIEPGRCVFHERHSPIAAAYFVQGTGIHWSHWSRTHAVGKGTATFSMVGQTPMKVRLDRSRRVCGRRMFSRATFDFPKLGLSGRNVRLQTCR